MVRIAIVLAALYAVRRTPTLTWVGILLGAAGDALHGDGGGRPHTGWIVLGSALLHAPFYFYVSYGMIRYLFHDDRVTRDELFATAAAFTVVAWGFAYVYAAVQRAQPGGSFTRPEPGRRTEPTWFELLYLSFAQLTSVGLSDVACRDLRGAGATLGRDPGDGGGRLLHRARGKR